MCTNADIYHTSHTHTYYPHHTHSHRPHTYTLPPTHHTHTHTVYEAMEAYIPTSEDEVGFNAQDRIKVIAKSMDGWWKIRLV